MRERGLRKCGGREKTEMVTCEGVVKVAHLAGG